MIIGLTFAKWPETQLPMNADFPLCHHSENSHLCASLDLLMTSYWETFDKYRPWTATLARNIINCISQILGDLKCIFFCGIMLFFFLHDSKNSSRGTFVSNFCEIMWHLRVSGSVWLWQKLTRKYPKACYRTESSHVCCNVCVNVVQFKRELTPAAKPKLPSRMRFWKTNRVKSISSNPDNVTSNPSVNFILLT